MSRKHYLSIILAGFGLLAALLFSLIFGAEHSPKANLLSLPASSPYAKNISGTGTIEANTKNINIGANNPGIIEKIYVREGDSVKENQPLFRIDSRLASSQLKAKQADMETAKTTLDLYQVKYNDALDVFKRSEGLKKGVDISESDYQRKYFALKAAEAQVNQAIAELENAKAALEVAQVNLDLNEVKAPSEGVIMKVYSTPGAFVSNSNIILMGNIKPLYVRVQIDESDIWRLPKDAKGIGFVRGNSEIKFALKLINVEPYVVPKLMLTGDNTEKSDTRVLEVIFEVIEDEHSKDKLYIGQLVDVFIESEV
jgi:RND family efflux transporter MFP subunit